MATPLPARRSITTGLIYIGISGGEFGVRGRLTALDAKTGQILWRAYTLPAPWRARQRDLAAWHRPFDAWWGDVWNTPALDPELGLVYFATGNCGPDYDGASREGDNLFCASIMAVNAKTGALRLALPAGASRHLGL